MKKILLVCLTMLIITGAVVAEQGTVRFLTINVWSGLTYNGTLKAGTFESSEQRAFRYGLLINELKKIDADVIALNEANMLPGYARRVARDLGYDFIYAVARGGVRLGQVGFPINLREGEVILAKKYLNLTQLGSRSLQGGYAGNFASFHLKNATQILAGKITVGEREVVVFNTMWHESLSPSRIGELVALYDRREIDGAELLVRIEDAVEGRVIRVEEAKKSLLFVAEIAGSPNPTSGEMSDGSSEDGIDESDLGEAASATNQNAEGTGGLPGEIATESAVVMLGNLNAPPTSEEVLLLAKAGLIDSWDESISEGYTWDELTNSNVIKYHINLDESRPPHRDRLSYIFYRGEDILVKSSELVLGDSTYDIHASDHYGVLVELEF